MTGELPSGTVTLLFTDIEGSTRMLQELGREAYVRALTEHRRLLREAFASHGGVEVEMQGDSFFFAFPFARDAVAAAITAQRALAEHNWDSEPIKVRVGLHTGEPIQTDGLYAGLDVHQAARVMSAAHGGQIILSARTAELISGEVPGVTLRDLGEHRLKDLTSRQRLFQVGEDHFPPLKTLLPQSNLPVAGTPFLGRARELNELLGILRRDDVRLVTLTGPGGTGKTRLALQAAAEGAESFPDGAWWVPLSQIHDAREVLPAVVRALGLQHDGDRPVDELLVGELSRKRCLLLLDNAEHLLPGVATELARLMQAEGPKILVTSRERLQLQGEHVWSVPSLDRDDARELFTARAAALGVSVTPDAVDTLCAQLDDLPLALELAAARTPLFTPAQLLHRLAQRLDLLKGGRDADPRQQTLRATIQWSYDLLEEEEKQLFRRLAVFSGGCNYDAAETVCEAAPEVLQSLLDKSLLRRGLEGEPRFWMLETIRHFALDQLSGAGETDQLRRRHLAYYLALAEQDADRSDDRESARLEHLELEQANLRVALKTASDLADVAALTSLVTSLRRFWTLRGSAIEGLVWLEQALHCLPHRPSKERCAVLDVGAELALLLQDFARAREYGLERLDHCRELSDLSGVATALWGLAIEAQSRNDLALARELLEEGLGAAREAGDLLAEMHVESELGFVAATEGHLHVAREHFDRSVELATGAGDTPSAVAGTGNAAVVSLRLGNTRAAAVLLASALRMAEQFGWAHGLATTLQITAALAARAGEARSAAVVFGAAEALREEVRIPLDFSLLDLTETAETAAKQALGPRDFDAARESGRRLDVKDAVCQAQGLLDRIAPTDA